MKNGAEKTQYYPLVVISDLHLGIKRNGVDALYEFLLHTKCKKLVLLGDIIDGERRNHAAARPFPASHARIIDLIHRKIADEGMEATYIPGNHDAALRGMKLYGKEILPGVTLRKSLDIVTPQGKKIHLCHGDRFDNYLKKTDKLPPRLRTFAMNLYLDFFSASARLDKIIFPRLKCHFQLATRVQTAIETLRGCRKAFRNRAARFAKKRGYDGIVVGHNHISALRDVNGVMYANTGDGIENITGIAMTAEGAWKRLDWLSDRKALGIKTHFNMQAAPMDFLPVTKAAIALIEHIWPGKGGSPQAANDAAPRNNKVSISAPSW